jgi:alpha-L-fucosidase 2
MMRKYNRREAIKIGAVATASVSPIWGGINKVLANEAIIKTDNSQLLWYNNPAERWLDALAIGNGKLGGMIFGGVAAERIGINEDTLWSGSPYDPATVVSTDTLDEIRRLTFAGKLHEAQQLANQLQGTPNSQAAYQTIGELLINFPGHDNYENYYRELDLANGITTVKYSVGDVNYKREVFASYPDHLIVVRITADKPGQLNFNTTFSSPQENELKIVDEDSIVLSGKNGPMVHKGKKFCDGMLKFQAQMQVRTNDGEVRAENNTISVKEASVASIYVVAATSYIKYNDVTGNPEQLCNDYLKKLKDKDYQSIKSAHIKDHQQLFNKVSLNLGKTPAALLPTDERVKNFNGMNDPALVALYFQFGRYLLISSSRPGSQPANLQGRWNGELSAPWDGKYTVNINTEMNYWPAQKTNLPECGEPLFDLLKDIAETGAITARKTYNARGWVCHHNTDLWRATAPIDTSYWGQWPMGGAWLSNQLYQHYLFDGDKAYLSRLYPIIKGAVVFFLDTLVKDPDNGWMVTCPSMSPEHEYEKGLTTAAGPTMDTQILRELFTNCIHAAALLKVDNDFKKQCEVVLLQLAPEHIGKAGQLQEWLQDMDLTAPVILHRHMSPLYGLFPGREITADTPELFCAARKLTEMRGSIGEGMGWAIAWRINLWARLLDADKAYGFVKEIITTKTEQNLFDRPSVQLDGNFGGTSGIAEMLLQSHAGVIHLLPALPNEWATGSITGLRALGGFEILKMEWRQNNIASVTIKSTLGGNCRIRVSNKLKGKSSTLKPAEGLNSNPFYSIIAAVKPVIAESVELNKIPMPKLNEYDLATRAGHTYELIATT